MYTDEQIVDFIRYLQDQIIPDSIAAGFEGYAKDLQEALEIIQQQYNEV